MTRKLYSTGEVGLELTLVDTTWHSWFSTPSDMPPPAAPLSNYWSEIVCVSDIPENYEVGTLVIIPYPLNLVNFEQELYKGTANVKWIFSIILLFEGIWIPMSPKSFESSCIILVTSSKNIRRSPVTPLQKPATAWFTTYTKLAPDPLSVSTYDRSCRN